MAESSATRLQDREEETQSGAVCDPRYTVGCVPGVGRVWVATVPLTPGDSVLVDTALLAAPDGFPVCVGCLGELGGAVVGCVDCGWPLCSHACHEAPSHRKECQLFQRAGVKPEVTDYTAPCGLYSIVAVLRFLFLGEQQVAQLVGLMDHWEERKKQPGVPLLTKYMSAFIRKRLGLCWVQDSHVQRAVGVMKTNGVGSRKVVYLYPKVSLMSHSCMSNLEVMEGPGLRVSFRVKRKVRAGEELSWSYTNFLDPKFVIQDSLRSNWMFDCTCPRCEDPCELGIHYSVRQCVVCGLGGETGEEARVADSVLLEEVQGAEEAALAQLVKRLENQGVHSTHYVMVRLCLRVLDLVSSPAPSPAPSHTLLLLALEVGPGLLKVIALLEGEAGKLMGKYNSLLRLARRKVTEDPGTGALDSSMKYNTND